MSTLFCKKISRLFQREILKGQFLFQQGSISYFFSTNDLQSVH